MAVRRLTDLFFESARRHRQCVAVDVPPGRSREGRVTVEFGRLQAMAAAIATKLESVAVPGRVVAILLPRHDPWLYAAQLGVLCRGAAFVCLDESFPDAHLVHVLRDAGAVALIADSAVRARLAALAGGVPCIEPPPAFDPDGVPAVPAADPDSLAYLIYTSGTTGRPKGVMIAHRGVVNLIEQGIERFGIRPGDRVAQGSSPAYDSSIEETWLALAAGATVVPVDDETIRLGPDLVPWLRQERITVLCPPPTLLRAMGCRDPRAELPELRLCYVGGEPLPRDLADSWGAALWLENGYGPTECTVTVTRGRVSPGRPVTIGRPVPPHVAFVLDEHLQPVEAGTAGELCIAGPGLARGYLGLPGLTAQRFPELPGIGRVYRTGDLVRVDDAGELHYLGRLDAQVKLRGHRIELEAIEAVLAGCEGVREVGCSVVGEEPQRLLMAWVVPELSEQPPSAVELAAAVARSLPRHAVPSRFEFVGELPRTVGGKLDRKALRPTGLLDEPLAAGVDEADPVRAAFAAVLGLPVASIGEHDDFFELGGDSLRVALLVSRLRASGGGAQAGIAVRDVYREPTPAALIRHLHSIGPSAEGEPGAAAAPYRLPSPGTVAAFTFGQVAFLLLGLVVASGAAYLGGFVLLPALLADLSLGAFLLLMPWLFAVATLLWAGIGLWLAVAAKELLIGRYSPMRAPAWGTFRLRHWLVVRLVRALPWPLVQGTSLQLAALRFLGARIGRRVHVHRGVDLLNGGWDLLEIGDDVTLGREVDLGLCELDAGELVIGAIRIGDGAVLATRSGTGCDVVVEAGAELAPLSFVPNGGSVPAGERWQGVPATRAAARAAAPTVDVGGAACSPLSWSIGLVAMRWLRGPLTATLWSLVLWTLCASAGIDSARVAQWLLVDGPGTELGWSLVVVLSTVAVMPLAWLVAALSLRWLPKVPIGTHDRWSWTHALWQLRTELLEDVGVWLSGTLFWPWWLRLAGMRIGRDVEVSTILDVLPEHTTIGGGSFLADGVYLGSPDIRRGRVTIAPTVLGERTFVGNHVVIAAGERLPDDLLLGISTVADGATMPAGSAWFGQPAFRLPRREVVVVDRRLTHDPGVVRRANRCFWEGLRAWLPALPAALALWWFQVVGAAAAPLCLAVGATFAVACALATAVLATKWLLLGRVRPGQHGLWSCWASRWDFHYVLWQRYARALLQPLEGTLLLPWFLRAIGMRIGRRCVLGDGFAQVVDPDMITIEDGATVHALFQAHSFEDRVLKIDRVRIGRGASVGRGTVVLYGADLGDGCEVMPHSVVMKRERLTAQRRYAGAPTVESSAETSPSRVADRAPASVTPAPRRELALDVARGLAVLGMVWLHFVPEPGDEDGSWLAAGIGFSLRALEGVPAALFLLLAGASWLAPGARPTAWVVRRSLALAAMGVPFWWWLWPNDVMVPLALMLPCVVLLHRAGRLAMAVAVLLLLAMVPIAAVLWGELVWIDCLEDGTHLANHGLSAATVRWFLFDGAYPLLPWLVLPLLGASLMDAQRDMARLRRWFALAVALPPAALMVTRAGAMLEGAEGGDAELAQHLASTWQPTSLPFLAFVGGSAIAITVALLRLDHRRVLPRWLGPFAAVGRASLTHYLAHIGIVYWALRIAWPAEDWPMSVGVAVACGYGLLAIAVSPLWFARFARGPLEALLRRFSGPAVGGPSAVGSPSARDRA